jgi:hypothetical protein
VTARRAGGARKPVDIGNGFVAASFTPAGSWLSVSCYHPRRGTVELSGMPSFDECWRDEPGLVRRYRHWMAEERHAFLRLRARNVTRHEISVDTVADRSIVEQRHSLVAAEGTGAQITLIASGHLDRPALAEITEVSPLPPTGADTVWKPEGAHLRLAAPALPATAAIEIAASGGTLGRWSLVDAGTAELEIRWEDRLDLVVRCTLGAEGQPRRAPTYAAQPALRPDRLWVARAQPHAPERYRQALSRIRNGARRYVSGCAALRVGESEVCFLADHRILPLSWTRDAYYQALLLLSWGDRPAAGLVADHLRWLYCRCRRERAAWQRSHLPNGEPKDRVFQADQQLYPLLELLDYRTTTDTFPNDPHSDRGNSRRWGERVAQIWRSLPLSADGFVATDENPADDSTRYPYLLSTQILAWYVAARLADVEDELHLEPLRFQDFAEQLRTSIPAFFTRPGPYGEQWAYEVDSNGDGRLYADANDLPTALAPLWRFCSADDDNWRATMRFAFSEHNPAYSAGPLGGLGSLHTPGTWPLGDVQEWVTASLLRDRGRAEAALDRLVTVSAEDGLLPEAYDPTTGEWRARHWFAWPAAVVGALVLNHQSFSRGSWTTQPPGTRGAAFRDSLLRLG